MGKLIDGDELIELLLSTAITDKQREYSKCVQYAVQKMPTVDAVPVQRCDGCRYADWHSNGCIAYCTKHGTDGHVTDSFCSEGEKDGEHETD